MKLLKRDGLSSKAEEMERVINALRSGSDIQASTLLARLRLGERVEDVAKSVPATTSSISSSNPSSEADDSVEERRFLSLLFDRQDFLLAASENKDEDDTVSNLDKTFDPRLLFEDGIQPAGSPMDISASRMPSPDKGESGKSLYFTHLVCRQPMVNTIRIHPNLKLRNLFGNLPFSNSVRANNYPVDVQDSQINNLFVPTWAMMPVNTKPDPGSVKLAFPGIFLEASALLKSGAPLKLVLETHPNIAALFDEEKFNASGILSKWAAGMVHSMMLKGNNFTCFAYMYLFWYLMRWMISPSPETYEMIPDWLRPTPNQLFMPHISIVDYVPWPAFRELTVQIPAMQERMEWLLDMSNTLRCDWQPFVIYQIGLSAPQSEAT
ncbi:hypothetical protein N0V94_002914 [Neodidymelliopsis sp. IMI 364377]|nr:hypothetical protein N0V94_002914 [Neodidymelliopsis sp. IMI 364377]